MDAYSDGTMNHSTIISSVDDNMLYYSAHSESRLNKPLIEALGGDVPCYSDWRMIELNKTKTFRALLILVIVLIVVYLTAGIILSVKTHNAFKKSEIPQAYVEDGFISASNYIRLSPYGSSVFDENGAVLDGYSDFKCDTDYFLIFPFVMYKNGRIMLKGSYRYSYSFEQEGDTRTGASMGEVDMYYNISDGSIFIDEICYGV